MRAAPRGSWRCEQPAAMVHALTPRVEPAGPLAGLGILITLGKLVLWGSVVRYASNRLRIHDLLRRHPEIRDIEIRRPVIVQRPGNGVSTPNSRLFQLDGLHRAATLGRFESLVSPRGESPA